MVLDSFEFNSFFHDQQYQRFMRDIRPLLISRENTMMLEFSFWATSPPRITNGIYELRRYELRVRLCSGIVSVWPTVVNVILPIQPGNLLEWEMHWRKGLDCRRQFCEPVGAWFSQLGDLNVVHHMWTYPDLQTRKITREDAWQVDGWAETVTNTGKIHGLLNKTPLKWLTNAFFCILVRLINKMQSSILKPLDYSPLR